jgi:hypothetical protein
MHRRDLLKTSALDSDSMNSNVTGILWLSGSLIRSSTT